MSNSGSARTWAPGALSALAADRSVAQEYPEAIDAKALWNVIAIIVVIDAVLLWLSGIRVTIGLPYVLMFFPLIGANLVYRTLRPNPRIAALALTVAQLVAFAQAVTVLSYLTVTSGFPLIDSYLAAADAAIGFHWLSYFVWVKDHPAIDRALSIIYYSSTVQIGALLLALNVTGQFERSREFVWLFVLTLFMIIPLSGLLPAESAWVYFGVTDRVDAYHLADFRALRAGQMPEIVLAKADGLVTFPSFHAGLGLILIFASRQTVLFPIYLVLNALMIVSALTSGGHYLVDLIAGLAAVPVAIMVFRIWGPNRRRIPR